MSDLLKQKKYSTFISKKPVDKEIKGGNEKFQ